MTPDPHRRPVRRRFRPRLWPTLITAVALAILVSLGSWQIMRMGWKAELVERLDARLAAPAIALPARVDDPAAWDYRRVAATGRYLDGSELLLQSRVADGRVGLHQVWPLEREEDGRILLVDRGWIPIERADPGTRPESLPERDTPVTVEGIARVPAEPGWMAAANDPVRGSWFRVEPAQMAAALGLDPGRVEPVFLERAGGEGGALPLAGRTRVDLPDNHLSYALTWYALALVLAIVYLLSQRRPVRPGEEDET